MTRFIIIFLLGLSVGCSSVQHGLFTHTLYTREIVLSRQHPEDDFVKAKLLAIAEDGKTTIQCVQTGDTLQAAPGEYFAPGPYGTHGLQLISASADKYEVHLLRAWCETK
jgi:hypothetical protein